MPDRELESLAVLREISGKLTRLCEAVERGRGPRAPADAAIAALVPAIWAAVDDRVFSSADLVEHATQPAAADLLAAIVAAVGKLEPRRIGKALHQLEGRNVGGLTVHRAGEDRSGAIWMVKAAGVRE